MTHRYARLLCDRAEFPVGSIVTIATDFRPEHPYPPVSPDGSDKDGMFWTVDRTGRPNTCIGRPGEGFEWVERRQSAGGWMVGIDWRRVGAVALWGGSVVVLAAIGAVLLAREVLAL